MFFVFVFVRVFIFFSNKRKKSNPQWTAHKNQKKGTKGANIFVRKIVLKRKKTGEDELNLSCD